MSSTDTIPTSVFADWCDLARQENEYVPPERHYSPPAGSASAKGGRPGDDYNRRADWGEFLTSHGWRVHHRAGDVTHWTRPGKDPRNGSSATTGHCSSELRGDLLYVFSSDAAPFEADTAYDKFAAYTLIGHNGDFSAAGKALARDGYGQHDPVGAARAYFGPGPGGTEPPPPAGNSGPAVGPDGIETWTHGQLMGAAFGPISYVVDGLVADGSVTIFGGVQKAGKSWVSIQAAQAVAAGVPLLDRATVQGDVIYLALEDGARRLQDRLMKQKAAHDLPIRWVTKFPKIDGAEGWLALCGLVAQKPRLLIIDTLAAAKGGKTDESDSGPMADLFNGLRELAQKYGVAILVVHHHGKSVSGDPAHDLRGSSAIGAAADVLLGLYRVRRRSDGTAHDKTGEHDPEDEASPDFYLKARGRDIEDVTLAVRFDAGNSWLWSLSQEGTHDRRKTKATFGRDAVTEALARIGRATPGQLIEASGESKNTVYRRLKDLVADGKASYGSETVEGKSVTVYFLLPFPIPTITNP